MTRNRLARRIGIAVVALLVALLAVILAQPSSFAVERSATIGAPPAAVYRHIVDVRALDAWMPWSRMDPEMKTVYEGPAAGVGARSSWEGPEMGKGRLTITAVEPDREVEMRLEMLEPMAADNRVRFTLVPSGQATTVTWRLEGTNGFVAKAASLVMDMDAMVGGQFELGLANLAAAVQAEPARRASID